MLTFYRRLLRLYPAAYRAQFGDEMLAVHLDLSLDPANKKLIKRTLFTFREAIGFMRGAFGEHLSHVLGRNYVFTLSTRSSIMRNGFRFPNAMSVLMMLILAGV